MNQTFLPRSVIMNSNEVQEAYMNYSAGSQTKGDHDQLYMPSSFSQSGMISYHSH